MYKIGLLYGDGIGPEITKATAEVMKEVVKKCDIDVEFPVYPMGLEAIEKYNDPLPQYTIDKLKDCDAWVFAPHDSVSYPKEHFERANPSGTIRHEFDLFSNCRPAKTYPGVEQRVNSDADVLVFRENSEGLLPDRNMYWGWAEIMPTKDMVIVQGLFTREATERIAHEAFKKAQRRKKHLTVVHKANVMQKSYGLFRDVVYEVGEKYYPEVKIDDYHIDAMTAHMVKRLADFDVIVTTNLFGDILSDLAGELTGSLGLGPAINTNQTQCMAQAAHGSAPDIAGKNIANPVGLMLSAAMMFDWLAVNREDKKLEDAAKLMEKAIIETMESGKLTPDMGGKETTSSFAEAVVENLKKL